LSRLQNIISDLGDPDISDESRESVNSELLKLAASDKAGFITFIRRLPLTEPNNLFEVYQALATDTEHWAQVMIDEMDRLFNEARTSDSPAQVLEPLEAIIFFQDGSEEVREEVCQRLVASLDSPITSIRRRAAWLLGDFIKPQDGYSIEKITLTLRNDSDWRVRNFAFLTLRDNQLLPRNFNLPIFDQLRARVLDEFVY
jgi:hypothetical protein